MDINRILESQKSLHPHERGHHPLFPERFPQELPPSGGFGKVTYIRSIPKKRFAGWLILGLFAAEQVWSWSKIVIYNRNERVVHGDRLREREKALLETATKLAEDGKEMAWRNYRLREQQILESAKHGASPH